MSVRILTGDCRDVLATLPDASVQCCVTSPPYYGLRDYGVAGQIGLEQTPAEYVEQMVAVFREVRRVLRDDGTVWLNLGDSYATGAGRVGDAPGGGEQGERWKGNRGQLAAGQAGKQGPRIAAMGPVTQPNRMPLPGLKPKDLIGIPWRVAFALQADGWWLRSDIIWSKSNPMPESVTDRPTSAHEHVFLLAKRERYFYDQEAIREQPTGRAGERAMFIRTDEPRQGTRKTYEQDGLVGSNARNVWTIATQPFPDAHFACMAPDLAERCIKAGTSERGCCANCGAPWARITTKGEPDRAHQLACGGDASGEYRGQSIKGHDAAGVQNASDVKRRILDGLRKKTFDWKPSCSCDADVILCTVLDPFGGAGTTGLVADRLGRDAILIELNPAYAAMAERRIHGDAPLFADVAAQ